MDARPDPAKLDALKELAYGASHEINNPLANIAARAQTLLRDEADPERRRSLRAIYDQAMRAHEMISDLMLFARPPVVSLGSVNVSNLLSGVVAEIDVLIAERSIKLSVDTLGELPSIEADANQLTVLFGVLLRNAVEAIGRDGNIWVTLAAAPGGGVEVTVGDDGPGLTAREAEHAFDPFFSGREAGRGLGFGLSKAWRIAESHGGLITVENRDGGGALARLWLPTAPPIDQGDSGSMSSA